MVDRNETLSSPQSLGNTANTANDSNQADVSDKASLDLTNALVRFEYEPGRGVDGTKVLMVEWEDDDKTRATQGAWEVSWEGKRTALPLRDIDTGINRLYFLLPEAEAVPEHVQLTFRAGTNNKLVACQLRPQPAVFPPQLGASATESGRKGVLHTIWAKRRLQVLGKEIEVERRKNAEGVALIMAIQERQWIEKNFGVTTKPSESINLVSYDAGQADGRSPIPASPKSPGGSRLMDKLKGLKLGTHDEALRGCGTSQPGPLSPEHSDVAISSFSRRAEPRSVPEPSKLAADAPPFRRRVSAQRPPEAVVAQQKQAGAASLDAMVDGRDQRTESREGEREDDLFALPMSPTSPETSKSPFASMMPVR